MILVQISDTHIDAPDKFVYGHFDTAAMLTRAIEVINTMDPAPDLVLHTGDIASHGDANQYAAFKDIADKLTAPLVLIPGNHDDRDALRTAFGGTPWLPTTGKFLHYILDDYAVRIICCDSVIAGETPGELCLDRLNWLDEQLSAVPDHPTIVALHHPPFYTGMTGSSAKGLSQGGAELDALLRRHSQVVRVLAGHVHRPITTSFGGTLAFAGPTTCYPFGLEIGPAQILSATNEPPAIGVHLWLPDATPTGPGLVSHVLPIGDWDPAITIKKADVRMVQA